jgi:lysozyme
MRISQEGRALIEAFENCDKPVPGRPGFFTTYRDEVGVLTIGFGHTNLGNVKPAIRAGDVWTRAQCDAALDNDMRRFEADVAKAMAGVTLNQGELDALVSFDFNTGSLAKSSIPRKIRAGDKPAAMATLLAYNHAGGRVLNGLTRRRTAEKLLFEGDTAAALKLAGAHVIDRDAGSPPLPKAEKKPPAVKPGHAAVGLGGGLLAALKAFDGSPPWWIFVLLAAVGLLALIHFRKSKG